MSDIIINIETDTQETPEIVVDSIYGPKGQRGEKGDDGEDGFSPIATVSKSDGVATITITDKNGTTTAEVYDGEGGGAVDSVNGKTGEVVLDAEDVGALPDDTTIPSKTSDLSNDSGFITGITSLDVTTALGYTPYNSSNPNGYTSNVGTVTSVNNTLPDANGNVNVSGGGGSIEDVKVNGASVVTSGVANITMPVDINDLSDVNITSPSTGQNLTYDSTSGKWKNTSSSATVAWGGITGTLSDQTDLKNALDAKQATIDSSNKLSASYVSGLANVATSGSYNDLSNTPTIPDAQVQSDWSQSDNTAKDFIKNKPTIPTVNNATLTIQKNSTTVQTFSANASSDVTCNISVPTDTSDLTNNAGFITSSALSPYELIDKTVNVLSTSGTVTLTDNSINSVTPSGNITFTLPTVSDNTIFHQILVQVNLSTVYSIDLGLGATPHYFNNTAPDLSSTGVYNLVYEYDKANQYWVVGLLNKGASS